MSRKLLIILAAAVLAGLGIAYALTQIGIIQMPYTITPSTSQAPSMNPSSVSLDLGDIPAKSAGTKEFQNVATLTLPYSYEITFTLDLNGLEGFSDISVRVYLYKPGSTYYSYSFLLMDSEYFNSESKIVDAGSYEVWVEVEYTAIETSSSVSGTVTIYCYW